MASKQPPIVRKSISGSTTGGARRDIPLSGQLQHLSAEPSVEQLPAEVSRVASPLGQHGNRMSVGSAAPVTRRSISAQRPVSSHQEARSQQHGYLSVDDSLVLYKDSSELSGQESMASVVSGRLNEGDTFYTALKRDLSFHSELDSAELQNAAGGGTASFLSTQLNPLLSPTSSAYLSAMGDGGGDNDEDEDDDYDAGSSLQIQYSTAAAMTTCESSYAAMDPEASCSQANLPPNQSVIDVINSLYCTQLPALSCQQQMVAEHGLSLVAAGGAAATMAVAPPVPAAAEIAEIAAHQAEYLLECAARPTQDSRQSGIDDNSNTESSPHGACLMAGDDSKIPLSSSPTAVDLQCVSAGSTSNLSETSESCSDTLQPVRQSVTNGVAIEARSAEQQQADSSAYLDHVDQLLTAHCQVQTELSSYLEQLVSLADEQGQKLVELPADYTLMVERRMRECRSEYRALEGWEGPHRFSDLPISQLPTTHVDPRIAAGLEAIRQLDEQLKEVWLKALVTSRSINPQQWAESERQCRERRASELDAALTRERQKRLRAARLLRALRDTEGQGEDDEDALLGVGKGLSSYKYYKLQPQDEQTLAAVLSRDEATLQENNPFDASQACLDTDERTGGPYQETSGSSSSTDAAAAAGIVACAVASNNEAGDPEAASAYASGRSSDAGSGLSRLSSNTSRASRSTLAEIDARLEVLSASQGQLSRDQSSVGGIRTIIQEHGTGASSRKSAAPSTSPSIICGSTTLRSVSTPSQYNTSSCAGGGSSTAVQHDYNREQREAKELAQREYEIDAKLRALRTSELPTKLLPEQLAALLQEASRGLLPGLVEVDTVHSSANGMLAANTTCQGQLV